MIAGDQPTLFSRNVLVGLSSINDGSMKDGEELLTPDAIRSREAFLTELGMTTDKTAVFYADFTTDDYCRYVEARPGLMPGYDGISTATPSRSILLPLADCVGAVIYDPAHHALMVSHLGRHSTEQLGGVKSIEYMSTQYGSRPNELLVWLGPSPNGEDYPLWAFDNRSFVDVLTEQLYRTGVTPQHIEVSTVDTSMSPDYFSHSQYLKGSQATDGRYAIAAMLR